MDETRELAPSRRADILTVACVLLALAGSETVLRLAEDRLSGNIAHVNEIQELASEHLPESTESLLFVGNSLTNNGVQSDQLRDSLATVGQRFDVVNKIVPDATTIWSWTCIIDNEFIARASAPDIVVIGFGWDQLSNESRILPTRLGAFFCTTTDLADIAHHKSLSSAEIGEFLTAHALRAYAHRETIRNRLLSSLVPNYQAMTQESNRRIRRDSEASASHDLTYSVLEELIKSLDSNSSRLLVMAMPVRDMPYEIDVDLKRLLAEKNVPLLDYRHLEGISDASFLDDMHLSLDGSKVLTAQLADDLSSILSEQN